MALWNNIDDDASKPKYLSDTLVNDQSVSDKDATLGVDVVEANLSAAKGINTPGWVTYRTYTDGNGNTRHKAETLVAFSTITGDASDDTVLPDPVITIGTQPSASGVTAPAPITLTVVASATGGATLAYQWYKAESATPTTFVAISGATAASYTIDPTATTDNGDVYRVVVSAGNATPVTSNSVTLSVA